MTECLLMAALGDAGVKGSADRGSTPRTSTEEADDASASFAMGGLGQVLAPRKTPETL